MNTDPRIIPVPPGADLTGTGKAIAKAHGVSHNTALRWKREAGLPIINGGKLGFTKGLRSSTRDRWSVVTPADWSKGDRHVGRKMGVHPVSALNMRRKLGIEASGIPRGRVPKPKKTLPCKK